MPPQHYLTVDRQQIYVAAYGVIQFPADALDAVEMQSGEWYLVVDEIVWLPKGDSSIGTYIIHILGVINEMCLVMETAVWMPKIATIAKMISQGWKVHFLCCPWPQHVHDVVVVLCPQ